MNKSLVVIAFLILIIFNGFWIYKYHSTEGKVAGAVVSVFDFIWGSVSSVANLFVEVIVVPPNITIDSPGNTTYFFNVSQDYDVALNVSADKEVQVWWYDLYNSSNDLVYEGVLFTPNTTFTASYGSNKLAVYANVSQGNVGNTNVTFSVRLQNASPEISLVNEVFVCEDSALSYKFNITDADEGEISLSMTPTNPFFVTKISSSGNLTVGEIFSGYLEKSDVGTTEEKVTASDGSYVDVGYINVTVIELNHYPQINTSVQTVWVNETLYYQIIASDTEDGNSSDGNISFNITFISGASVFNINSTYGFINYTPTDSEVGNYNVSVCVIDQGITYHDNLSLCNSNGNDSIYNCSSFMVTVTNENRAPNITNYYPYPENITISVSQSDYKYFNASADDPDGTTPDINWYLDSSLIASAQTGLNYSFADVGGGNHTIKALATDGELNDSVIWNVSVTAVSRDSSGGGGGGGGGISCNEKWVCNKTKVCQNLEKLALSGIVDAETKRLVELDCLFYGWPEEACGVKLVDCFDVNKCKTTKKKPLPVEACYYVEHPSCDDKIKNCHDGACEILVDCGGPCEPCPTCDDGLQNQGEQGIDCGGPCPNACPEEIPKKKSYLTYIFTILILILLIAIIIAITHLIRIKKRLVYHGAERGY